MPTVPIRFDRPLPACLIVAILAGDAPVQAEEPYFPALAFLPGNEAVNSIRDDMTSVHLKAMGEPSLWRLAEEDRMAQVYRFLWLHPGQPQVAIRLAQADGAFTLHVAGHDGPPGMTAGRLSLKKEIKLTDEQGAKLVAFIEKTNFWTAPAVVKESGGIADGDGIVIEGARRGAYHVIDRAGSTASTSYMAFGRALLDLADEPAVLKAWDRIRKGDRRVRRSRAEPTETEDRGDPPPVDDRKKGVRSRP